MTEDEQAPLREKLSPWAHRCDAERKPDSWGELLMRDPQIVGLAGDVARCSDCGKERPWGTQI